MGGSVGVSSPPVGRPRAAQWGDRELPSGEGAGPQWGRAASPTGAHIDQVGGSLGNPLGLRHLMCPSHLVGLTFLWRELTEIS